MHKKVSQAEPFSLRLPLRDENKKNFQVGFAYFTLRKATLKIKVEAGGMLLPEPFSP